MKKVSKEILQAWGLWDRTEEVDEEFISVDVSSDPLPRNLQYVNGVITVSRELYEILPSHEDIQK